jgi:hypothetical protein
MKLLTVQFSPSFYNFHCFMSRYSSQHLFSNILNPCSSLSVRDQLSLMYKTTCKIIVLYLSIEATSLSFYLRVSLD